jgi:uncharacterized repeat protein (TIGR01451 family)
MASGLSRTVHITANTTSTSCAVYNNTAHVTTTNDGSDTASASETVLCSLIHVAKIADAASVSAGSPIGFTVTVNNSGAGTATGVTLTDALPGGNASTPVHWTIDGSTGNPTFFAISGADGSQHLTLAEQPVSMAAGLSRTVHLTATTTSTSCAVYNNSAGVTTTNDGSDTASASETVLCPTFVQQVLAAAVTLPKAGAGPQGPGVDAGRQPFGLALFATLILVGITVAWQVRPRREE